MELAHISDLHLPLERERLPGWGAFLNKRLFGWLNLQVKRRYPPEINQALASDLRERPPDHLAVTGDLTNLSLACEFEAAARWLAGLGLPPERLTVIPGNHDAYVGAAVRERLFERALGPLLGEADLAWPRVQRVGDLLLVSASSAVPSPWFVAWGRVGREQLARLDQALAAEAAFKLLLVHHPPLQRDGRPDWLIRRNRDWKGLLELCWRRGVDLVLCGHTHRGYRITAPGGPRIFCAGSATDPPVRLGERSTYNRYRFEGGRLVGIEVRAWDRAQRSFVTVHSE